MNNVCLNDYANGSLAAQINCTAGTDFYLNSRLGDFVPRAVLNHPVAGTFLQVTVTYISVADVLVTGNFVA